MEAGPTNFVYSKSRTIMLYPIEAATRFAKNGQVVIKDVKMVNRRTTNIPYYDVRLNTETEMIHAAAHEFGHALGLMETGITTSTDTYIVVNEPFWDDAKLEYKDHELLVSSDGNPPAMKTSDIMLMQNYSFAFSISPIDIQMIVMAAKEEKMQWYSDCLGYTKSKGADKNQVLSECPIKDYPTFF